MDRHGRFINDQSISRWDPTLPRLAMESIKQLEHRPGFGQAPPHAEHWLPVEDQHALWTELAARNGPQFIALVNAAGYGKTISTRYLEYVFSRHFGLFALRLTAEELAAEVPQQQAEQKLIELLMNKLHLRGLHATSADLRRLLMQRKLLLVIDALDQMGTGSLSPFFELLGLNAQWKNCRVLLTGRPPALVRNAGDGELFDPDSREWTFLRLEKFTPDQCRAYLQRDEEDESRYDQLSEGVKEVLAVPRVLSYLRKIERGDFQEIETAADVLGLALRKMIIEGLQKRPELRLRQQTPGIDEQDVTTYLQWLATIAFQQTAELRYDENDQPLPNFTFISQDELPAFTSNRLGQFPCFQKILKDEVEPATILHKLADLNIALNADLLEAGTVGLAQIQFQNRSLQEWLAAYYLANHATADDRERVWKHWIYEWDIDSTAEYKEIWTYFADLKSSSNSKQTSHPGFLTNQVWLETTELLYRPCFDEQTGDFYDELPGHTDLDSINWQAKRSPEFIHLTWFRLKDLCELNDSRGLPEEKILLRKRARKIRDRWLGEFEAIAAGKQGKERAEVANFLKNDFLTLPGGTFHFGTARYEESGIPEEVRHNWEKHLERAEDSDDELRDYIVECYNLAHQPKATRDSYVTRISSHIRHPEALSIVEGWYSRADQKLQEKMKVEPFHLQRRHVRNDMFRLFAPRHGLRGDVAEPYRRYSGSPLHASLYHDWYSAWCYATWCYFENKSCSLPLEHDYEYAAKFGMSPEQQQSWDYWWAEVWEKDADGNDMSYDECHGNKAVRSGTAIADPMRASAATKSLDAEGQGLIDLQGNAWQWCGNRYQDTYSPEAADKDRQQRHMNNERLSIRFGGWHNRPSNLTICGRSGYTTVNRNHFNGFRLHRTY